jgi:hypothetical protein
MLPRLIASVGLLAVLPSCVLYDPELVGMDAGRDAGMCTTRRPEPRPTSADDDDVAEVAFGLRQVNLNQGSEWESIGYDLDGLCTGPSEYTSECIVRGPRERDGMEGIDNVFGRALYPLVDVAVPGLEEMAIAAQEEGRGMPVLRVRQWNGTPNDPQVEIAIAQAVFGTSLAGVGDAPPEINIISTTEWELPDGRPVPLPVWDGNDFLWLRTDAFLAGDLEEPLIIDRTAYVVNNTFVARLPDRIDIIFPTDDVGVLVRLTNAVATGHLSDDGLTLDPLVVAGRWRVADLLSTAQNIGLCRGSDLFRALELQLQNIADVLSMQPDPGAPLVNCDAVTIGVTFIGTRAVIADVTPGLPLTDLCMSGGDGGVPDGGVSDSGTDAGRDAGVDAGEDAGDDAG